MEKRGNLEEYKINTEEFDSYCVSTMIMIHI